MALQIVCDGCGEPIEEGRAFEQGFYNKAEYCQKCNEIYVKKFEEPVKAERAKLAAAFDKFMADGRSNVKNSDGFKKLPDEVDDARTA